MSRSLLRSKRLRAVAGAIAVVYVFRSLAAWLLALPVLQAAANSGVLNFPAGDAVLFEPGASYLLEFLSSQRRGLLAASSWYWMAWLTLGFAGLWPQWLWFRASAFDADTARPAAPLWPESFEFALLGALSWLARGTLLVVTLMAALALRIWLLRVDDERVADLSALGVVAAGLVTQGGCSVWHDVSRAVLVRQGLHARAASARARALLRQRWRALGVSYVSTLLGSAALIAGGAALVSSIDPARPSGWSTAFAFASHQGVVLASLACRAVWINITVRAATPPRPDQPHAEAFL